MDFWKKFGAYNLNNGIYPLIFYDFYKFMKKVNNNIFMPHNFITLILILLLI